MALRHLKTRVARLIGDDLLGRLDYHRSPAARHAFGGPLNGQARRAEIVAELLAAVAPASIVETGTFRGTTTEHLARTSGLPVFTVEADRRSHAFARERFRVARLAAISAHLGDSRAFLGQLVTGDRLPAGPVLVYLDAHWGEDLPLAEEIAILFAARPDAVAMVDDFQVPDDPGYGYDDYGPGKALTAELCRPAMARFGLRLFYPSAPSGSETGRRRGCCVLAGGEMAERLAGLATLRPG